jgi:hypothetical protein
MKVETSASIGSSYRFAGWAAIASGVVGIVGVGYLIAFLTGHLKSVSDNDFLLVRIHDGCVIIQFLLMIRVVFGLRNLSLQQSFGISQTKLAIGVGSLSFTILFLLLNFPKVLADVLYMFPQGIFGGWLIVICWQMKGILSGGLRWFGMFVGLGLSLVGIYPLGYAIFVDTIILQIPAPTNEVLESIPMTFANGIIHLILMFGSLIGVLTLPFWTILIGRRLLQEKTE